MKKFILPVLAAVLVLSMQLAPAPAQAEGAAAGALPYGTASPRDWNKKAPDGELQGEAVKAESAILVDQKTGKVLFQKEPDKRLYPASITKIMTCLLAVEYIESGHNKNELVTIGVLPKTEPSSMGLKKGETLSLEDMLYGLMLKSGNDVACAVAIHVGGTIDEFVAMMNAKAKTLGMENTQYANPHGLHDDNHYTTARDMSILTREAMKHPLFRQLVSTPSITIPKTNMSAERKYDNHNKLISKSKNEPYGYVYATGGKTGFTSKAMHTLVSSAENKSVQLISVVMKDTKPSESQDNKFIDSVTMFEYGFSFYDTLDLKKLLTAQVLEPLEVKNAAGTDPGMGKLQLTLLPKTADAYITDRKEIVESLRSDPSQFVPEVTFTKDTAPIAKDEVVGTVTYRYHENVVFTCDLLASREVKEMPTPAPTTAPAQTGAATNGGKPSDGTPQTGSPSVPVTTEGGGGSIFVWVGLVLLMLLMALVAIRMVNLRRRNRKYRQYNYKQGSNGTRARR